MKEELKEGLSKEWDAAVKQMISNIEWGWETLRMYLTIMGFLLVAYNYMIYQFTIPYVQKNQISSIEIVILTLLIPILSLPLAYITLEIFEYRYRRFLDNVWTLNRIRKIFGVHDENLHLYPVRYYKEAFSVTNPDLFVQAVLNRKEPPTFYTQGKKFIVLFESVFLIEAILITVILVCT